MKATLFHTAGAIALTFTIAACVPQADTPPPVSTPAPAPAPTPTPAPRPSPTPTPTTITTLAASDYEYYLDGPQTPGTWTYGADPDETLAFFAEAGSENAAPFIMRCGVPNREIWLARRGNASAGLMRVSTETVERTLTVGAVPGQRDLVAARLPATDPLLDAMAITKGRFAVETAGLPTLYLPAWTEVTRVIEDCR